MINKLYKFVCRPDVLLVGWLMFILSPILGIVRLQFLSNPKLTVFHIRGLSTVLLYAPFCLSVFVLVSVIIWSIELTKNKLGNVHRKYFNVLSVITVVFLCLSQFLINREFNSYPNFLYEHYGVTVVQLQLMSFVASIQILIVALLYIYKSSYKSTKNLFKNSSLSENFSLTSCILGIICLFILSGSTILNWPIIQNESKEGYDGKVGIDYKYINLLVDKTPTESLVIHPPQGDKWPAIGNQPVLRYFLFPRTLVSGALIINQESTVMVDNAFFVEIDPGGSRVWPNINFKNKTISFDELNYVKYQKLEIIFKNKISNIYKINF